MSLTTALGSTACRPRFATPRDERFPTHGPAVGEVARRFGRPLMEWQQALADVAYEYDPDSGLFRYNEVDITVPRQSGKTTITFAKKVYRLTAMARQLGPQRSTYTAQTRLAARKKLERDFSELLRSSRAFREVPNAKARPTKATEWRLSLNNGSEAIQFGHGSFLQIDAPSRTGGHGDTLDDGTIDEAFSQEDDTVEAGMRPSMATRRNAQLWVISTAGDARSAYLWRKVLAGRSASEAGEHGSVCYVEYSAEDDAEPGDPGTWYSCMPALGTTITEAFIAGEWERAQRKGQEGINTFRRAYLNQWPDIPTLDKDGARVAFNPDVWASLADPGAQRGSTPFFAVATAPDRSWSAIGVAWLRADGLAQVMLADYRPGAAWVGARADDLRTSWGGQVACDTASRGLVDGAVELSAQQQAQAHNALADAVEARSVRHGNEPAVLTSVRAAQWRRQGDTRVLDRKGGTDISPLVAVSLALAGALAQPTAAAPRMLRDTSARSYEYDPSTAGF